MNFNNLFQDNRETWVINNEVKKRKKLISQLELESTYELHNDSYMILLNDFDSFKNDSLINKDIKINSLNNMITSFSIKEDYEKCGILQQLLIELN